MKIYKYAMREKECQFKMPKGAEIVHCDNQNGYIVLWALIDENQPLESRYFAFFATGANIDRGEYIGTVLQVEGAFVWHVFELM